MKVTTRQAVEGYRGLSGMGASAISPRSAMKAARLIAVLRDETVAFEKGQEKAYLNAGGEFVSNGVLSVPDPVRTKDETDEDFAARTSAVRAKMLAVKNEVEALLDEETEIKGEPLPYALFLNDKEPDKSAAQKPNDVMLALPFLVE